MKQIKKHNLSGRTETMNNSDMTVKQSHQTEPIPLRSSLLTDPFLGTVKRVETDHQMKKFPPPKINLIISQFWKLDNILESNFESEILILK